MPGSFWSETEDQLLVRTHDSILEREGTRDLWVKVSKAFKDRNRNSCRQRYEWLKRRQRTALVDTTDPDRPIATETDPLTLVAERVITLEELLEHYQVDANVWQVVEWKANKYETGAKHPVTGAILIAPLFQISARLKPHKEEVLVAQAIAKGCLEDIRAYDRAINPVSYKLCQTDQYCFEYDPFDLHMGKYAWAEETVTDYDVDIAEGLFNASLDYLLEKALRNTANQIEEILFPIGNDASHVDGKSHQTTGGTPMEAFDSRYVRVFRTLCKVHRRAVSLLREVAPVKIIVVPGNHDEETAFHLGDHLEAYFHTDPHVSVYNSARLRKYHEYGVTLLGFTHGVHERMEELPLLMAREQPEAWARCPQREWHIGHLHKAKAMRWRELDSDKGVRVRILSSLSAHDYWHTNHGYTDRRACDAFLWHRRAGFTDHLSFNVDHFSAEPMR
jgi:hypothetical protein